MVVVVEVLEVLEELDVDGAVPSVEASIAIDFLRMCLFLLGRPRLL